MGFRVEKQTENSCVIWANNEGDDSSEFLIAAQAALKNLWLHITIDLSMKPQSLGVILPHLLKLQQVIASHHRSLSIRGVLGKVPEETINRLMQLGIQVQTDGAPPPFASPGGMQPPTPSLSTFGVIPLDPEGVQPLPPASVVEARFKDIQGRLAQALKRGRYLESEKRVYSERIKTLKIGLGADWHLDQSQIEKLADLEAKILHLRDERSHLQRDVEESLSLRKREEEILKKALSEISADTKKKKDVLEKQLADVIKKHDKVKADFKKKSDSRKEKLARTQK